jgi:hypothetical protein
MNAPYRRHHPDGTVDHSYPSHQKVDERGGKPQAARYFQTHECLAVGQNPLEAGKAQTVVVDAVKLTQNH